MGGQNMAAHFFGLECLARYFTGEDASSRSDEVGEGSVDRARFHAAFERGIIGMWSISYRRG